MPPREPSSTTPAWLGWLHDIFLIRPNRRSMTPLFVWVPLAVLSMGAASAVAWLRPESLGDLWLVREWLSYWLTGANPYRHYLGEIDYPPTAFLVLWPLAVPSDAAAPWLFVPWAIASVAAAAFMLSKWLAARAGVTLAWYERVALVAMLMSAGSARTTIWTGQTAALAVLFGALALYWSPRRPAAAAIALAFSAYKPHVAIGFALAIFLTERRAVVWWAAGIVMVMWGIFAATIERSVGRVLWLYTQSLQTLYDGPERIRGLLSIRFAIEDFLGHYEWATAIHGGIALVTLTLLYLSARRRTDAAGRATIAAACLLWPLIFLPNQLYHAMMAWPAIWLLMWPEVQPVRHDGLRLFVVIGFISFGVLDVPRSIRLINGVDEGTVAIASYYLSPLRLVLVMGLILNALYVPWPRKPGQKAA